MKKETKTQWHPAFCAAVRLELVENKADLDYTNEYNLNSKPIQMDLLVIKKSKDVEIKNEMGKIFRGHNIMEYKSPQDDLNLDTYVKVIGYACMYKASEVHVGDIELDDITITLVREGKPRELLKWFDKNDYKVFEKYNGIYYVEKEGCFPIQIIVSGMLSVESQKWLTLLSRNLERKDAERIVIQSESLTEKDEKLYADSVLEVAVTENEEIFAELRMEEIHMCEALRRLMKEDLEEAEKLGEERGRESIIMNVLKANHTVEEVAELLLVPLEEVKAVEKELLSASKSFV